MTTATVAVTGANGRLGGALVTAVLAALGPAAAIPWTRPELDLDEPASLEALVARDAPEAVVHAAAWTDVDACSRQPELARRRNGAATAVLARACAARGMRLVAVSTNEVFDGRRIDGRGYAPGDAPNPGNAYGASKLEGERGAAEAFETVGLEDHFAIVRTAWLFGPPGRDFPDKILDAAARASSAGEPLRLVADEVGNPTFAPDLAAAIIDLLRAGVAGTVHLVNAGSTSRADWARSVLAAAGMSVPTEDVPMSTWPRDSLPPPRAVLAPSELPGGSRLRAWEAAMAAYMPALLAIRAARADRPTG